MRTLPHIPPPPRHDDNQVFPHRIRHYYEAAFSRHVLLILEYELVYHESCDDMPSYQFPRRRNGRLAMPAMAAFQTAIGRGSAGEYRALAYDASHYRESI